VLYCSSLLNRRFAVHASAGMHLLLDTLIVPHFPFYTVHSPLVLTHHQLAVNFPLLLLCSIVVPAGQRRAERAGHRADAQR
jgi:hypothetical protein